MIVILFMAIDHCSENLLFKTLIFYIRNISVPVISCILQKEVLVVIFTLVGTPFLLKTYILVKKNVLKE